MHPRRIGRPAGGALLALVLSTGGPLAAAEAPGAVTFHGFGSWGYGLTDGNLYQLGDDDGKYDNAEMTLVATTRPVERLQIFGQIHLDATGEEVETSVDYILAEWKVNDSLFLRLGRAHHPFGIYGESFRIGTLRPFITLPQGIYGRSGMIGENFNGVALRGTRRSGGGHDLRYDVYAGNVGIRIARPWIVLRDPRFPPQPELTDVNQVVGVRLTYGDEIRWRAGVSAYHGTQEAGAGGRVPEGNHAVVAVHGELLTDRWLLRAEVARHEHLGLLTLDGAYLELSYSFTEQWRLAGRYDRARVDIDGFDVSAAPSLWEHDDLGLALSYWFTPGFVVKLEGHTVDGNRFALPADLAAAVAGGGLDTTTELVQLAAQFSF